MTDNESILEKTCRYLTDKKIVDFVSVGKHDAGILFSGICSLSNCFCEHYVDEHQKEYAPEECDTYKNKIIGDDNYATGKRA